MDKAAQQMSKGDFLYLYYFRLVNCHNNVAEIRKSFREVKETERSERAYSKLNNFGPEILYVGSSKNLRKRFKDHLGYGSRKTYSI